MYSPIMNSLYIRKNIYRTEYIRVFVLHRKLETNKISVRRKAESTRFGEKKGFPWQQKLLQWINGLKKSKNDPKNEEQFKNYW